MNANYSEYRVADLDSDGQKDIFILRFDAEQPQGVAELYHWKDGQLEREPEAYLTAGPSQTHFEWESDEGCSRCLCCKRI